MTTALSSLFFSNKRLREVLRMYPVLATVLSQLFSWRFLAIILALINLKSLPLAWHLRMFGLMIRHGRNVRKNVAFLRKASQPNSTSTSLKRVHPLFRPVEIASRTSLYETDYNFHKSNSTYFADLDHSRTALVASLLGPALADSTLVQYGEKPGILYPILGSVHTSFLREIKPLQSYTIRSRLLGWDRKWLVIASNFVRPATRAEKARAKKDGTGEIHEILLACALNKYVIKQGRKTIEPGLALAGSGWYRPRPGITHAIEGVGASRYTLINPNENDTSATATGTSTPVPTPSQTTVSTAETVGRVVRRLSGASGEKAGKPDLTITPSTTMTTNDALEDEEQEEGGWTWKEINEERLRGLSLAENWLGLDSELREEYLASRLD